MCPPFPRQSETDKSPNTVKVEPQISKEDSNPANEEQIIEGGAEFLRTQ